MRNEQQYNDATNALRARIRACKKAKDIDNLATELAKEISDIEAKRAMLAELLADALRSGNGGR